MKKGIKLLITFMLALTMILQVNVVFGAINIPTTVTSADGGYRKIPVIYNNNEISQVTVYLQKSNTTAQNANERFNISCTANFYIDAYVYKTGENIKIGTLFTYKDENGNWVEDWLDQTGQVTSDPNWMTTDYKVEVNTINFMELTSQPSNKRVEFKTSVKSGNTSKGSFSRYSSSNVAASAADVEQVIQDGITVTKTAKELAAKNVWEIEVKVEGKNVILQKATDVVLVLDRSGSMGQGVIDKNNPNAQRILKCTNTNKWHTHGNSCYDENYYILKCTQSHTHILPGEYIENSCCISRADKVKSASYAFLNTLQEQENVNISVVTYAGEASLVTNTSLTAGIESAYNELGENGTNTGKGIEAAMQILAKSSAPNKMIVLLSDGESNKGDSKTAASNAKKQGCIVYTIGAGITSDSNGAKELRGCASVDESINEPKFYLADDASNALNEIFTKIAGEIQEAGSKCEMSDTLSNEFKILVDSTLSEYGATKVELTNIDSTNWSDKNVIYTQGQILMIDNKQVKWDIGTLSEGVPAIIRYRVNMISGALGVAYPISTQSQIDYIDNTGTAKILTIPGISKKAIWAGIKFDIYGVDSKKNSVMKVYSGVSPSAWLKVPDDASQIPSLKVGLDTRVNSSTLEIEATGDKTLAELSCEVIGDTVSDILGVKVGSDPNPESYRKEALVATPNVTNTLPTGHGNTELKATLDRGYNLIQPEGVTNVGTEIKFNSYTKDITYEINIKKLLEEAMGGDELMKFTLPKTKVRVEKLLSIDGGGNKSWSVIDKNYYLMSIPSVGQVDYGTITVKFNEEASINPFNANGGEVYRIIVYIPTNMQPAIKYSEYITNYINNTANNTINATATITGAERIKEAGVYDGIYYDAEYANLSKSEQIGVNYIEMAKIN